MRRYLPLVMLTAILLGGCGPETLPPAGSGRAGDVVAQESVSATPEATVIITSTTISTGAMDALSAAPIDHTLTFQGADGSFSVGISLPFEVKLPCGEPHFAPADDRYLCWTGSGLDAQLWVASTENGLIQLLSRSLSGDFRWSPDGRQVAYVEWMGDQKSLLRVISLDNGQVADLGPIDSPHFVRFSRANEVAYIKDAALQMVRVPAEPDEAMTRRSLPLATAGVEEGYKINYTAFEFSPRNDEVAILTVWGEETGELKLVDLTSGKSKTMTPQLEGTPYLDESFAWSPNGGQLAYITQMHGESEVWLVDSESGLQRLLWRATREPDGALLSHSVLRWLPNGQALILAAQEESFSWLYRIVGMGDGKVQNLFKGGTGLFAHNRADGRMTLLSVGSFYADPTYDHIAIDLQY